MSEHYGSVPKTKVGVVQVGHAGYPTDAPFHPFSDYPEYPFHGALSNEPNHVYEGVRTLLVQLGLDKDHYGTDRWNPLGKIIQPGMTVVLKPNFVLSRHEKNKDLFSVITHPSVIRAVADYCWISLNGEGRIIIADAPQYNCDFGELLEATRLEEVREFYSKNSGPNVEIRDLRNYWSRGRHFPSMVRQLPGDPEGMVTVNLRTKSAFHTSPHPERFYGAVYHREETISHHKGDSQEYEVSGTVMKADVFISLPKMKVHKKVGVTLNGKGLVGVCTNKNLVVHYTLGSPQEGGDQYPDGLFTPLEEALIKTERWMYDHFLAKRIVPLEYLHRSIYWLHGALIKPLGITVSPSKRLFDAGNWHGNDSAWRMVVDLMKIIHFADRSGILHDVPQRRLFSVVDGIIGGENNGPLAPDPKPAGILVGGENLLAVDLVSTRLMGFDPLKLKQFSTLSDGDFNLGVQRMEDIEVISSDEAMESCLMNEKNEFLSFRPHPGWVGQIEVNKTCTEGAKA